MIKIKLKIIILTGLLTLTAFSMNSNARYLNNIVTGVSNAQYGTQSNSYDLLIITTDEFKGEFQRLATAHNYDGVTTEIKTSEYGSNPESVRNLIKSEYENHDITYVLIGGDQDIIPVKKLKVTLKSDPTQLIPETRYVPSDLYYACLDGNGPGGTTDDLVAEVYVGRACVSNQEEAKNFVDKTIAYMNVDPGDPYLKNVLMAGEYLWAKGYSNVYGSFSLEKLINSCSDNYFFTKGIPHNYNFNKLYDADWEENGWPEPGGDPLDPSGGWPKSEIIDAINNNPHIINHEGHGDEHYIMKMDCPDALDDIRNNKYFFLYSQACLAGDFTAETKPFHQWDCITEYLTTKTEHGAFAAITNSGVGIGGIANDGFGPSDYFHREFWDAVFGENILELGRANQDSKEDNLYLLINDDTNLIRYCYYELNLFGDPAVKLKVPDNNNAPPNLPVIEGPTNATKRSNVKLNISSTDPEGDKIYYLLDWGDGWYCEWFEWPDREYPYNSGDKIQTRNYSYNKAGTYTIRVKAKDNQGAESEWSEFEIHVTKGKSKTISANPLARFPVLEKILSLPILTRLIYLLGLKA